MNREELLKELNPEQKEAVVHSGSDSLILAGAGSGKTRVLTTKIAYLLTEGVAPFQILALTFTNKAAREMRERIGTLVGGPVAGLITMGTFHSVFARFLRSYADRLGYNHSYTIYDTTDSKSLVKMIVKELQLDEKMYKPSYIQAEISNAKNSGLSPRDLADEMVAHRHDLRKSVPALPKIYREYETRCQRANAMDFDDLLLNMLRLLQQHEDVKVSFHERFKYILIDEYQDTNRVQHKIVQRLKGPSTELMVVGDDAQSIYSFRGAVIDNIINFQTTFPGAKLFKLTKNYRSTGNIVELANGLIAKNEKRIPKVVEAVAGKGEKSLLFESFSAPMEAQQVAAQVNQLIHSDTNPEDIAILYRTNAQSRLLEQYLKMFSIPTRIYGGLSFFDRKEVKDLLAYLRLVINPDDDEAFRRVYNVPARGIGAVTFEGIAKVANEKGLSLMSTAKSPEQLSGVVRGAGISKLSAFVELIEVITSLADDLAPIPYLQKVIELTGLKGMYNDGSVEGQSRMDNIAELVSALDDFITRRKLEQGEEEPSLEDFVREMTLYTDQDTEDDDTPKVTLMTMHASKGLEFDHIFCVGLEEGIIPSNRSTGIADIEEERRLLYVAITRAKEHCTLSYARERMVNGQTNMAMPSRFLRELDPKYVKDNSGIVSGGAMQKAIEKLQQLHRDLPPTPSAPKRMTRIKHSRQVGSDGPSGRENEVLTDTAADTDLKKGDIVYHNHLGRCEILGFVETSIMGSKVSVRLEDNSVRQLILKFAKLRKE